MSDTNIQPTASLSLKEAIIDRLGMPLLVFSGVMFGLLLVSSVTFLPAFTAIHRSDGVSLSPHAVVAYEQNLANELKAAQATLTSLVLPITDPTYTALKARKHAVLSLTELQEQLRQAAGRLGEEGDVVMLTTVVIDGTAVTVTGDVRNAGTRSMTVLAAFTDEVSKLPFVTNLERPPFTREQLPDGSFHSPFTFTFSIHQ